MTNPVGERRDYVIPGFFTNPVLRPYLRNVLNWQGYIRFLGLPDRRDNPDIVIDRLFVMPLLTRRYVSPDESPESWFSQADTVFSALEEHTPLVLLGDPGAGKTTLLNQIAWLLSRPATNSLIERIGWRLPLPMVLRELPIRGVRDFDGLLEAFLTRPMSEPLRKLDGRRYLEQTLAEGNAFLLLDGIDEIGDSENREMLREAVLDGLRRFPNCRWLLSSRIVGYDEVPFDRSRRPQDDPQDEMSLWSVRNPMVREEVVQAHGRQLHPSSRKHGDGRVAAVRYMAPFDDSRIAIFARHWYAEREASSQRARMNADHLVRAIHADRSILRLARVPSLLAMMALIHRIEATLPHGRALLYERIAEAYLESIDKFRGIDSSPHDLPRKKGWLARVGFEMQRRRMSTDRMGDTDLLVDSDTVLAWLNEQMGRADTMTHAPSAREFLEIVGRRSGLFLPRGEGRYAFVHLSFQEYFAAVALEREVTRLRWARGEKSGLEFDRDDVARWAGQSVWRETFSFLFELLALRDEDDWHADLLDRVFGKDFSKLDGSESGEVSRLGELLGRLVVNPRSGLSPSKRDEAIACCVKTQLRLRNESVFGTPHTRRILSGLIGHETELDAKVFEQIGVQMQEEPGWRLLDMNGASISDLGPLAELTALEELYLMDTPVSDLGPLAKLTALKRLDLEDTSVSDLGPLAKLTALEKLHLSGTPVSDLGPLAELTALKRLDLRGTPVSDLKPLAELTALEELHLSDTPVSDLKPLAELTALAMLFLSDTQVSDDAVQELRISRPDLKVSF